MKALDVKYNRAYNLLRELVLNGKMEKFGKGRTATYKHIGNDDAPMVGFLNKEDSMKLFLKVAS